VTRTARRPDRLGCHRVLEPLTAVPQTAWRIDNTPVAYENEILCDVELLNIDSASFRQIIEATGGTAEAVAAHILSTVRTRGKQHNPVTESGGMFVGRVAEVGAALRGRVDAAPGDRIASLVSLALTPLCIETIEHVDLQTGRMRVRAKAILFESGIFTKLPDDIETEVALAVLDVAGAPAQVRRLVQPRATVVVVGADGKSGVLCCVEAKRCSGADGRVVGIVPAAQTPGALLLQEHGFVDDLIVADARNVAAVLEALPASCPQLADLVVNCVNVPGTELSSIMCAREGGIVYFFSMSTSFATAALGAEAFGKDISMLIGNGYTKGHAATALRTLRDHPPVLRYFNARYGNGVV
jgi:L-erythro-3,5-diaminohexanoate dehydrogenase